LDLDISVECLKATGLSRGGLRFVATKNCAFPSKRAWVRRIEIQERLLSNERERPLDKPVA